MDNSFFPELQQTQSTPTPSGNASTPNQSTQSSNSFFPELQQSQPQTSGVAPGDIQSAEQYVGQPIDEGLCEQFAEQVTDGKNWGDTAYDAFQNQLQAGLGVQTNDVTNAPIGSKIYFASDNNPGDPGYNGGNGHVGILIDNKGNFVSADYSGVHENNLSTWSQTPIGYVPQ